MSRTSQEEVKDNLSNDSDVVEEIDECGSPCFEPEEKCSLSDLFGRMASDQCTQTDTKYMLNEVTMLKDEAVRVVSS